MAIKKVKKAKKKSDKIENNSLVLITQLKHTDNRYGVNDEMRDMVGKQYIVDHATSTCATIEHFYWDIRDLELVPTGPITMKGLKKETFDPSLLVT